MTQAAPKSSTIQDPVVFERDGAIYTNTRDVAACFEKRHADVLREIDNLLENNDNAKLRSLFSEAPYTVDRQTRTYRSVDLTKDGFTLLAMGFTGAKALAFKLAYIERFNAMETALRNMAPSLASLDAKFTAAVNDQRKEHAELSQKVENLIAASDPRRSVSYHHISVKGLLDDAKCLPKGRNSINRRIGSALRKLVAKENIPGCRWESDGTWLFPLDWAKKFMADHGNAWVADHNASVIGQGTLNFAEAKRKRGAPKANPETAAPEASS